MSELQSKRCTKCGELKPLMGFYRDASTKDGYRSSCKTCSDVCHAAYAETHKEKIAAQRHARYAENMGEERVYARAYYYAHREDRAAYSRAYYDAHREEIAAKARVYHEAHAEEIAAVKRAYRETHAEETSAVSRVWRETHKEEIAAYGRAYREAHKEKRAAIKREWGQTQEGRASGVAAAARRRAYPGERRLTALMIQEVMDSADGICPYCGEPFEDGHIDHVVPVSKDGTSDRENLVYCCAFCNLSKGAKLLGNWLVDAGDGERRVIG